MKELRLRWYGHVQGRDDGYIDGRMLDMELPGNRKRGRLKRSYMDGTKEDKIAPGLKGKDALNRASWGRKIRCGVP